MKIRYLIFIFLLLSFLCFSQNRSAKTIVDAETKQPLSYVFVSSDDGKLNLLSNPEGQLILITSQKIRSYTFYKIGYRAQVIKADELLLKDTIFLAVNRINLGEVTISAEKLEAIVKDKRFYVDDYLILPNNDFLVITSRINTPGFDLVYYKKERGITHRKKFPGESNERLIIDCLGNIHLLTGKYARQIFFDSDSSFNLFSKFARERFDSTLAKCALKIDSSILFTTSRPPVDIKGVYFDTKQNSPFLTYIKISKKTRQHFYTTFYSKALREMMGNEVGDSRSIRASLDDEGATRASDQSYEAAIALFFEKVAKPIYSPVFLRHDSVILFNFQEMNIIFFDKGGQELKRVAMDPKDFSTFHDHEIIYDKIKQEFYFKTMENDKPMMSLINVDSGKFAKRIRLEKTFAKNIQVLNNRIYYLVKEKEWDDTCYLYQQNP